METNVVRSLLTGKEQVIRYAEMWGPNVLKAIFVLALGFFFARWVGQLLNQQLKRRDMDPPLRMLLVRLLSVVVVGFTLLLAVQNLGVQVLPLIAGLGVAGVGIGLAMQGVLSNLVAGLTIIFVKKFRIGEFIEIHDQHGRVELIELFSTTLVRGDKSRIIIPNRKIVGEIIHNYGTIRQLDLSVGVAYSTDLDVALAAIRDVLERNDRVLKDPTPVLGTGTFGDSSIVIVVKPWVKLADFIPAQAEINKAIVEEFRARNVQIPFPQREVRVLKESEIKSVAA